MKMSEQLEKCMYYWCIVPECKNTSISTPKKVFIQVPTEERRRKQWLVAVSREDISRKTVFVCEDHFDLEHDMENYMRWRLMGGKKLMKNSVVPHKFISKNKHTGTSQTPLLKKPKLDNPPPTLMEVDSEPIASTSTSVAQYPPFAKVSGGTKDVGIEVKPYCRSKQTQTCNLKVVHTSSSPIRSNIASIATSPIKKLTKDIPKVVTPSDDTSDVGTSSSHYMPPTTSPTPSSETATAVKEEHSGLALKHTKHLVSVKPRLYLGVPKQCMYIIELIQQHTLLSDVAIFITLQKIRLAQTFMELGDAYGCSESSASRYFTKSVTMVATLMKELIISPPKEKIRELLPLPFRARYSKVQYIIDCLEIEIQKPSDPVKQTLTWSEYKKANTLKYLISSTPNGIINYISTAFGGRASDDIIVEKSGFLETLQPNTVIMADRGFKHIEQLLSTKNYKLLRPPSVSSKQKLTKSESLQSKRIASLRIHIERVIRRVREFRMLKPHSCVNTKLTHFMDDMIVIACGLVNIQGPIVR